MGNDHVAATIATYNKTAHEFIPKATAYVPSEERELFLARISPKSVVLDAGCGSGRDANYFASHGHAVIGIDLSETLLSYARKKKVEGVTFLKMDIRNISFPKDTFDGVWACASLLHLTHKEIPNVIRALSTVMKDQGTLFLLMKEGEGECLEANGSITQGERFFSYFSLSELKNIVHPWFDVDTCYTWNQKDRNPERPSQIWISLFAKKRINPL